MNQITGTCSVPLHFDTGMRMACRSTINRTLKQLQPAQLVPTSASTLLPVHLQYYPVLLFSKLNKIFFGYLHPEFFFKIMKINNFQGDLTDISAKKEALVLPRCPGPR